MRGITGTIVVLLFVGYLATTIELPQALSSGAPDGVGASSNRTSVMDGWRRTEAGWQWHDAWEHPRGPLNPLPIAWRIHPFLIAAMQVLISLFALVWADQSRPSLGRSRVERPVGSRF